MATNIPPIATWAAIGLERQLAIRRMSTAEAAQLLDIPETRLQQIRNGAPPVLVEAAKLYGRLAILSGWYDDHYPAQLQTIIAGIKKEPAKWARDAGYPEIASSMQNWLNGTRPTRMSLHSIYLAVYSYLAAETAMLLPEYDYTQWNPAYFDQFRKLYDIPVTDISQAVNISPSTIEAWLYGYWDPRDAKKQERLRQWFATRIEQEYGPLATTPVEAVDEEAIHSVREGTEDPTQADQSLERIYMDFLLDMTREHLKAQGQTLHDFKTAMIDVVRAREDLAAMQMVKHGVEITVQTLLSFIPNERQQVALAELGKQIGKAIQREHVPFELGGGREEGIRQVADEPTEG